MTVCAICGSKDIWFKQWVDPNTGKLGDMVSDGEDNDQWCDVCDLAVEFTDIRDELTIYGIEKGTPVSSDFDKWIERAEKDGTVWSVQGFADAYKSNPEQFKNLNFKIA